MKLIKSYAIERKGLKELLNTIYQLIVDYATNNPIHIGVFEGTKKRSLPQNAYYWGVIVKALVDITGHNKDDIHELLCNKFIHEPKEKYIMGEWVKSQARSSGLTTKQFNEYCNKIRKWVHEWSNGRVDIPNPDGLPTSVEMQILMEYK